MNSEKKFFIDSLIKKGVIYDVLNSTSPFDWSEIFNVEHDMLPTLKILFKSFDVFDNDTLSVISDIFREWFRKHE